MTWIVFDKWPPQPASFNHRFAVVGAHDYNVFRDLAGRIANGDIEG